MDELLPKWVMKRYLLLSHELGDKSYKGFTFKEAEQALKKLDSDNRIVALFLSELRKAGWLEAKQDKNDARKKIYLLKKHEEVFDTILNQMLKNKKFMQKSREKERGRHE
jgi:hypothetical protein